MIIYKITNILNGKVYVGQTIRTLEERWTQHCSTNSCKALRTAIDKYGRDNFVIEQIDIATNLQELDKKEIYWIGFFGSLGLNGYNLTAGGEGVRNLKHSEQSKKKMSKSHLGKRIKESSKKKMSDFWKNNKRSENHEKNLMAAISRPRSAEVREKISKANKGKIISEKQKKQTSVRFLGFKLSSEHKENIRKGLVNSKKVDLFKKAIKCVETNVEYKSLSDAARTMGIPVGNICKVLSGERKTAGGYTFKHIHGAKYE